MTSHVKGRGIVAARRHVPPFQLIGGEEVIVNLQFLFGDGIRITVAGSRGGYDFGRLGLVLWSGVGHSDRHQDGKRKSRQ